MGPVVCPCSEGNIDAFAPVDFVKMGPFLIFLGKSY